MPRITERKKEMWISKLERAKSSINSVVAGIEECDPFIFGGSEIEHLENLTCELDEAIAELQAQNAQGGEP